VTVRPVAKPLIVDTTSWIPEIIVKTGAIHTRIAQMSDGVSAADGEELARRLINDVWSSGDLDAIDELVTEDYVDYYEGEENVRGRDGLEKYVSGLRESFPDFGKEIKEVLATDEAVALRFMATGTHEAEYDGIEPTGVEMSFAGSIFFHFKHGKISETYESADTWGMMEDLGAV
jgi:steroid delta-isomerase-like uncharacterized protein